MDGCVYLPIWGEDNHEETALACDVETITYRALTLKSAKTTKLYFRVGKFFAFFKIIFAIYVLFLHLMDTLFSNWKKINTAVDGNQLK